MNTFTSTIHPSENQHKLAKSMDEAFHTQLAKTNKGMSPISQVLAYAD